MSARAGEKDRGRDVSATASSPRPTARARSLDSSDRRSVDAHARTSLSRGRVDSDTLLSADSLPLTLFDEISAALASSGSDETADNPAQRVDSSPTATPPAGLEASGSAEGPPSERRTRSRSASVGADTTHQRAEITTDDAQSTHQIRASLAASSRWVEPTPRPASTRMEPGAQAVSNPGFAAPRSPVQTPVALAAHEALDATDQPAVRAVSPAVPTQGLTADQQAASALDQHANKHGTASHPAATSVDENAQTTHFLGSVAPRSPQGVVGSVASRSPTDEIKSRPHSPRAQVTELITRSTHSPTLHLK